MEDPAGQRPESFPQQNPVSGTPRDAKAASPFKHNILVGTAKQLSERSVLKWRCEKHYTSADHTPGALPIAQEHTRPAELFILQQSGKGRAFSTSDLAQCVCLQMLRSCKYKPFPKY